jgi:hypothetical protein
VAAAYNVAMADLDLTPTARRRFERLAGDIARIFEARLVGVVATSQTQSVVFAESVTSGDLDAAGALVETWHKDELDTPLLLTAAEFRRSLDAFPVEYRAIVDRHVVIAGQPPFQDLVVSLDHLRRACEVQAKGHLIHLRQGWLEAAGHDEELADLIFRSAAPLAAVLSNVARLHGASSGEHDEAAIAGARLAGLPESLIRDVLALDAAPDRSRHLVRELPAYLAASEQLWTFVDTWRAPS